VRLFTPPDDPQTQRPDPEFTPVFDGLLLLPDGRITVGDVEQQTRFVHRVGDRGQGGLVRNRAAGQQACERAGIGCAPIG
jgi:hypothetical protein